VTGGWRKLHHEVHNLYFSTNMTRLIKSRRIRSTVHVTRIREMRNAYNILIGKPEGKRPLRRLRC